MTYTFPKTSGRMALEDMLLKDLRRPAGLTPLFGIGEREAVVVERVLHERRLAGERLQNISALLSCIEADYEAYRCGRMSKDRLLASVWATLQVLHRQTVVGDAEVLGID